MTARAVILDSNLLALLLIYSYWPDHVTQHRKTRNYSRQDSELLLDLSSGASLRLATHVLVEASNLIDPVRDWRGRIYHQALRSLVECHGEVHVPLEQAGSDPEFDRLGLTDAVLLTLAGEGSILLTSDDDLASAATARGRDCLHLRPSNR